MAESEGLGHYLRLGVNRLSIAIYEGELELVLLGRNGMNNFYSVYISSSICNHRLLIRLNGHTKRLYLGDITFILKLSWEDQLVILEIDYFL